MIVERFVTWAENSSASERAKAAAALARAYVTDRFDRQEMAEAEAALTLLVEDPEDEVRAALSEAFCENPRAPRHIVSALSADKPEIAMPVLARSPVFIEAELVDIAATGSPAQQIAIACRRPVGAGTAAALAEVGVLEAAIALLMNDRAVIPPAFLQRLAERHIEHPEIQKMLAGRADLPPQTWLLLIEKGGERLREQYSEREWLPPARIDAMVREQFDKAIIACAASASQADLQVLVGELITKQRLSTAFLLRALCMGNISLLACALGQLSSIPGGRIEAIFERGSGAALNALLRQAGIPSSAVPVFVDLLANWREVLSDTETSRMDGLPCLVTRRVLENYGDSAGPELDRLLVLLRDIASENERDNARSEINRMITRARERATLSLTAPETAGADGDVEAGNVPETAEIVEEFDIPEMPPQVVAEFAMHFAEEILDLEEEFARESTLQPETLEVSAETGDAGEVVFDIPEINPVDPVGAANDDRPEETERAGRRARAA